MGANPIAFVGADFSFTPEGKYYDWEYDKKFEQDCDIRLKHVDIFGKEVITTQGFYNMKHWFDQVCMRTSGLYINCTEGGIMGSYDLGNIAAIQNMPLKDFFRMYRAYTFTKSQCESPGIPDITVKF